MTYKIQNYHEYYGDLIEDIDRCDIYFLLFQANLLRRKNKSDKIELCAIINAKSGFCPEDCKFCAQSSRYSTGAPVYPLIEKNIIIEKALEAKKHRVKRFSVVISGKKPQKEELKKIASYVEDIRKAGIHPCASLGLLDYDELCYLRDKGLERLHCNIETSEKFFSQICTTHKFSDKVKTLENAKKAGISVCSGGILGMGESWTDRVDMAYFLKKSDIDSIPINFLTPVEGTPLGNKKPLDPMEALRVIALFRLILPDKDIRICGGRPLLGEFASWIFIAGANALMTGNYLTTRGRHYSDDLKFIEVHGLKVDDLVS